MNLENGDLEFISNLVACVRVGGRCVFGGVKGLGVGDGMIIFDATTSRIQDPRFRDSRIRGITLLTM